MTIKYPESQSRMPYLQFSQNEALNSTIYENWSLDFVIALILLPQILKMENQLRRRVPRANCGNLTQVKRVLQL